MHLHLLRNKRKLDTRLKSGIMFAKTVFTRSRAQFITISLGAVISACLFVTPVVAQTPVAVEINGIDSMLESNVRLFLSIEQQKDHPLITAGRLQRLHKKANQEIAAALQPFGYYRSVVESSLVKSDTGEWRATYSIDPGPALAISEFNFNISSEMAREPEFVDLLQNHTLKIGTVFNHLDYEKFKANLENLAAERGYFDAKFTQHQVEIDLDSYVARIHLNYEGGIRYRFGTVILQQNVLHDELLQRYIPFKRGDPYTLDKLIELQQILNDTYYFQTADVSAGNPVPGSDEVPIEVSLTPRKKNRYETGLGYGTDTGARAKFSWIVPRVNKRGHRFSTDVEVSEIGYSTFANYRVPVFDPRTDQLVYSAGQSRENVEDTDSTLRVLGVSLIHGRGEWRETLAINYQEEDFEAGNDEGDSTLLIPGISWSRTWGSDFINVLDGIRLDLSLRGASESLISDNDFGQFKGHLKFITSLSTRNRIITRGGFGTTWTREFDQLPTSVRFFTGGAQTVRGYKYLSLGPTNDDDEVVGGRHLILGSIEFEHYFNDRWGVAVFFDAGNAIDNLDEDLKSGAGFGFRWKSPVGPVRIDLASALSKNEQPWRFHINIGPDL